MIFCFSCDGSKEQKSSSQAVNFLPVPWTHFRGNASLDGISLGHVSDSMKLLWSFKTGGSCISSPVTDGKNVFIGSLDSTLYSLNIITGDLVWKTKLGDEIEASPVIFEDVILIGDLSGNFYSVNKQSGEIIWKFKAPGVRSKIVGSANIINEKKQVLFGSHNDTLYCLNIADGEVVWRYQSESYINGTPATDGVSIVFGGCDSHLHVVDASNGAGAGKVDVGSHIAGSAVLKDNFAYVGSYGRKLFGINTKTMEIAWTYENDGRKEPFFASPALKDTFLIAPSRDKFVHAVSSLTGNLIWKFAAKGAVDSSPVIAGDRVIAGCESGFLYLLDLKTGEHINSFDIGAAISGAPLVSGAIAVVGDDSGMVSALYW
ncbi:MAG: PQQ-binding-like beta-propeller repeat protein [Chitinispirillia bacterium]|nr:PQQ-binding-like beta-propeller repeat protein [Chitinispirillia bacterium]